MSASPATSEGVHSQSGNSSASSIPSMAVTTTALHDAARMGLTAEMEALLAAGAPTEVYDEQGATPLLWASQQGHHEVGQQSAATATHPHVHTTAAAYHKPHVAGVLQCEAQAHVVKHSRLLLHCKKPCREALGYAARASCSCACAATVMPARLPFLLRWCVPCCMGAP